MTSPATIEFVPAARTPAPTVAAGDLEVAAPPEVPPPAQGALLTRLLPVVLGVAMIGATAALYRSGSVTPRTPMFAIFPALMLISVCVAAASARGRRGGLDDDRRDYLDYLSELRRTVATTAAAQRAALRRRHPDPTALWTVVGGDRMWERRGDDPDFTEIRVGVGARPLATRLIAPRSRPAHRRDPVTAAAVRRFVDTHATVPDTPITITLRGLAAVAVAGDPARVRGLLRAMLCQLAVWHGPDQLLIAGVVAGRCRDDWDWLKWLPHHQHPTMVDDAGPARMMYPTLDCAQAALGELRPPSPHLVVLLDGVTVDPSEPVLTGGGRTVLQVGPGGERIAGLRLRVDGATLTELGDATTDRVLARPDHLDADDALVCARRLAGYRAGGGPGGSSWPALLGLGDPAGFDPTAAWRGRTRHDRLRVPIGTTAAGATVHLDIKEAAEQGMGPHGLCVGATGSGKSELLRTVALGLIARHSPDELNLVLVDFKGGATFLGLERAHHVAAVITNLADAAPLVARMRDALAGEMTRRQELLRAAGCVSVAAYDAARRAGARRAALPTLFIIVDEFSELLSQHPDFVDMFGALGRLGRSLGMHLLLASQRLDEGRLRGLDSHLSYRICLKTLSASESRLVLGAPDAHELPATPGAGYLRTAAGELIRFQSAYVSGPCPVVAARPTGQPDAVRPFTAAASGPVRRRPDSGSGQTLLDTVLDRLAGHGARAHRVWLPPLGAAPALDSLLTADPAAGLAVPIGLVDRPLEQRRTPLRVDLSGAAGNVAVIGAPVSGKSTALCTVITALATAHDPTRVQFYCLDFGGGALESVRALPHVGAVAGRAEPDLVERVVTELEAIVGSREARFRACGIASMAQYRRARADGHPGCAGDRFGDVFLVVDGWARLRHDFDALDAAITALAGHGLSFGVHVMLSAARWADLRPALKDQIGTRIELRLGDPAESEVDRRRAQRVPTQAGHGLTGDGLHMVIAVPRPDRVRAHRNTPAAPPVRLLPTLIDRHTVLQAADEQRRDTILVGLDERELRPVALEFGQQQHLLVLGDTASGKTSVLRTVCQEITRTATAERAQLVVVDYRRALLGVVAGDRLRGYAMSAAALADLLPGLLEVLVRRMPGARVTAAQLRTRSWWSGPEVYLVIDDYDLVATAAGNPLTPILEFLPHAGDLGLHIVLARRTGGAARAMFEPLLAGLRDLGAMGLMLSGHPDDGPLLGSVRPVPLPPGRGTLLTRGGAQRIQVAWTPPP
ncbi:type VII secretion protein EccCa [Mycobacterium sp. pUA109]|uniref:type VII secretion protein EccCa n=1 Tax=Mycobacterium sp. pUA109 TaxID=3238982 RepID=UPI00351B4524